MVHSQREKERPNKETMEEKLEALQITRENLSFFTSTFVQNPKRYMIKELGKPWEVRKKANGEHARLIGHDIASHLLGRCSIAAYQPRISRYLCLRTTFAPDCEQQIATAIEWLQYPIGFFFGDTKRLHLYAHFGFVIGTRSSRSSQEPNSRTGASFTD